MQSLDPLQLLGGVSALIGILQFFVPTEKWPLSAKIAALLSCLLIALLLFGFSPQSPPNSSQMSIPSIEQPTPTPTEAVSVPRSKKDFDEKTVSAFKEGERYYKDEDYDLALEFLLIAAEGGHPTAELYIGYCYQDGLGVEEDQTTAFSWFKRSALGGNAEAQSVLGDCYRHGKGVALNLSEAVYWYELSAAQNSRFGLINLGYCYHHGLGVEQDYDRALELYYQAQDQGHSMAQKRINEVLAEMG